MRLRYIGGVTIDNKGRGKLKIDNIGFHNSFWQVRVPLLLKPEYLFGAIIGDGSIVGSNTIVTKPVPSNSLAVGAPVRVVRQDIMWTREQLF